MKCATAPATVQRAAPPTVSPSAPPALRSISTSSNVAALCPHRLHRLTAINVTPPTFPFSSLSADPSAGSVNELLIRKADQSSNANTNFFPIYSCQSPPPWCQALALRISAASSKEANCELVYDADVSVWEDRLGRVWRLLVQLLL